MTNQQEAVTTPEPAEFPILVEWPGEPAGIRKVSRGDRLTAMQEQSQKAINMAMGTIRAMAWQVARTMDTLGDQVRPDEAEVEFGINLDAEAGALLAKASTGAQITVKLKWTIAEPEKATVLVEQ